MPVAHQADPHPPLRVLIVDDDATIRHILSAHAKCLGHDVMAVGTRAEAMAAVTTIEFDVVATDVLLPDGDGIDVLSFIRSNRPSTRVIAMSGGSRHLGPEFFTRIAAALGAVVLKKPFVRDEFLAALQGPCTTVALDRSV